jgi:hypothetical protein
MSAVFTAIVCSAKASYCQLEPCKHSVSHVSQPRAKHKYYVPVKDAEMFYFGNTKTIDERSLLPEPVTRTR